MTDKQPEALRLADALGVLAEKFSEGWHAGIQIDASDIMLNNEAAAELHRLHEVNAGLVRELQNIANANPRKWEADVRDQFQQWAQSRANAAIAKATVEQQ